MYVFVNVGDCYDPTQRFPVSDLRVTDAIQVLSTVPVLFNYWAVAKDCLEVWSD